MSSRTRTCKGARHPKRWQDVEELLAAGIDVFTTLNVQHLESLNDVVGGITNVRVWETVPDTVFDDAEEVVLVDIPAEELLERLKAGKVYVPQQAERAANNFFRKGNLMALRELALRRTADRVEGDVQAYRVDKSIESVWKTANALLTCVGPDAGAERVVRGGGAARGSAERRVACRLCGNTRAAAPARRRGARGFWGPEPGQGTGCDHRGDRRRRRGESVVAYARSHNLSKLVIGRDPARRLWPWQRSSGQKLALLAPDIDLIEIGRADGVMQNGDAARSSWPPHRRAETDAAPQVQEAALCLGGARLRGRDAAVDTVGRRISTARISWRYIILTVVLVAVRFGRGAAAFAAVLSVCSFDFFFVPPRFSFAVSDVQYLLTFGIMLAVGLITGQLTAGLRFQARVASHREERAGSLYEIARDLSGAVQIDQVVKISDESIERTFRASAALAAAGCRRQVDCGVIAGRSRRLPSISASRNGRSTRANRRASVPIPCRAARCCTFRCARRPRRAACWPSRRKIGACCAYRSSGSCSIPLPR